MRSFICCAIPYPLSVVRLFDSQGQLIFTKYVVSLSFFDFVYIHMRGWTSFLCRNTYSKCQLWMRQQMFRTKFCWRCVIAHFATNPYPNYLAAIEHFMLLCSLLHCTSCKDAGVYFISSFSSLAPPQQNVPLLWCVCPTNHFSLVILTSFDFRGTSSANLSLRPIFSSNFRSNMACIISSLASSLRFVSLKYVTLPVRVIHPRSIRGLFDNRSFSVR